MVTCFSFRLIGALSAAVAASMIMACGESAKKKGNPNAGEVVSKSTPTPPSGNSGNADEVLRLALREARARGFNCAIAAFKGLSAADPALYPGIAAFLVDFDTFARAGESRRAPDEPMQLEAAKLTTQNPNFWRAFLEIEPADPVFTAAYAGMLMSEGLVGQVSYIYLLILCSEIEPGLGQAINEQFQSSQRVIESAGVMVNEGIGLFDAGDLTQALEVYANVLEIWPQSSFAEYETGLTLMSLQKERTEFEKHYGRSREFDPFQTNAYQGEAEQATRAMIPLLEDVLPTLKQIQVQKTHTEELLEKLSAGCLKVPIPPMAIIARLHLIARRGKTVSTDHEFLESALAGLLSSEEAVGIAKEFRGRTVPAFALTKTIRDGLIRPKRSA